MIRSIISRDTCINYHVTNVQHGSACSCTTFNYLYNMVGCLHVQQHTITIVACGKRP